MSALDDELEAEIDRILSVGQEGRRDALVRDLTAPPSSRTALRVGAVAAGIVGVAVLLHAAGVTFAVRALRNLCAAAGLCG